MTNTLPPVSQGLGRFSLWLLCAALAGCADGAGGGGADVAVDAEVAGTPDAAAEVVAQPGAPNVVLLGPDADSVWKVGQTIPVSARVTDPGDPVTSLTYVLRAAGVGVLAEGGLGGTLLELGVDSLSQGAHVLTLEVRDPAGHVGQASVAVRVNRPPAGATLVTIAPGAPTTADALLASVQTAAVDPDGQVVTYRYSWKRDGAPAQIAQAQVPSTMTARGQTWEVLAVPSDGDHDGEAGTASVVIGNALPTIKEANLLPSAVGTDGTLTCGGAGWADADGDAEGYRVRWFVDGKLVAGQDGATLSGDFFDKGQVVRCEVVPWDGLGEGVAVESASVPVLDTPPSVAGVEISPTSGTAKTTFTCSVTGLADPDGTDSPSVQTVWVVDGEEQPGTTSASYTPVGWKNGTTVQCKIVPTSGSVTGSPVLSEVVVLGNAAPSVGAVIVTPVPATKATGVMCVASEVADPDGDEVTLVVTWKVDGVVVAGESGTTLGGEHYAKGQSVSCAVVPWDGAAEGASVASKFATPIQNSAPSLGSVGLGPVGATAADTLVCSPAGFADLDGDSAGYLYAWTVDGAPVAGAEAATLAGAGLGKGDEVVCTVRPFDGEAMGAPVSSATLTIGNSAPSLESASVTPVEGGKLTVFTCVPAGHSDPDEGDLKLYTFRWFLNGAVVDGEAGATFVPGVGAPTGSKLRCEATPSDGLASGTPVLSEAAQLKNQAPTVGSVSVGPEGADATTTLACVAVGAMDADGDTVTVSFQWTVDDALVAGETGATLAGGKAKKGQTVRCVAVPSDGVLLGSPVQSQPLVIGNSPPVLVGAAVAPAAGPTTATFTCSAQGASDPDGDGVTVAWRWLLNGGVVAGATGATFLPGAAAAGGDLLSCEATPSDGVVTGKSVTSAPITLDAPPPDNEPPTVASAAISPGSAVTATVLTCTVSGVADPEGKAVTLGYTWTKGGVAIGGQTSSTLPAAAHKKGDSIRCSVTPFDGELYGSPATSAPVVIGNTAPTVSGVTVSPAGGLVTETFTCVAAVTGDVDGDTVTLAWRWLLNGGEVPGATGVTYSPGAAAADGDTLACGATPGDGTTTGAEVTSVAVPLEGLPPVNEPPTVASAAISPGSAVTATVLTCTVSGVADPEGKAVTLGYTWTKGGVAIGGQTSSTLPAAAHKKGDSIRCSVTPFDGELYGSPATSAPVVIGNTAPTVSGVTVSPAGGLVTETFTCVAAVTGDVDGDTVTLAWRWLLNGGEVPGATGVTYSPGAAAADGDTLACGATPGDGTTTGATVTSVAVPLEGLPPVNEPPTVASAAISPGSAVTTTVLTCNASGASDPEGKTVTLGYVWTKDSVAIPGQTAKTLPAAAHQKGDAIRCRVTPYDGELFGAPVTSAAVVIANTAPVITDVLVTPQTPAAGEALLCAVTATDADNDPLTPEYQWFVDQSIADGQVAADLSGGVTQSCEEWTCVAKVTDGTAYSGFDEDSVTTAGAGGPEVTTWFGHHSYVSGPAPKSISQFFSTEIVATRIAPPAAAFPYTLTKVRFLSTAMPYRILVYADSGGSPQTPPLYTQWVTGDGTFQEVTLDTPLSFATQTAFWLGIGSSDNFMVIKGDGGPPDATKNWLYGCLSLGDGCLFPPSWGTLASSGPPFSTFGDLIIDAGTSVGGSSCP
jgi:hypothetical protein